METKQKLPPQGVIIDVRPTDFMAGGETGILARSVLAPSGQLDEYLPDEETQFDFLFDTFGCVSFSANNAIETIFNFMLSHGLFSAEKVQWLRDHKYIDYRTGKVNFSDRFTAKMSGTTKNGNSLGAVGDSCRHNGLVPESMWPWPKEMTENMSAEEKWMLYYAAVPQAVQDMGKEFAELFDIAYQWIIVGNSSESENLIKQYLPLGPLQIASSVCLPWNANEANPPINGCGCGAQHATLLYGYEDKVAYKDFDQYKSFRKLLAWNYCIPYAMQYYAAEKTIQKPVPPAVNLVSGAPDSAATRALQACLQYFKDANGIPYMKPGVFGPFGPQTKSALARYQTAHSISDYPQGAHFGPKTRAAMVADLKS